MPKERRPGGDDQVMRTMQTLLNIVEFGMNIQQSIEAARWSTRGFPSSVFPHSMYPGSMSVEDRIPQAVRDELLKKGHRLGVTGPWILGSNGGIAVDPATGVLSAGGDPRRGGQSKAGRERSFSPVLSKSSLMAKDAFPASMPRFLSLWID